MKVMLGDIIMRDIINQRTEFWENKRKEAERVERLEKWEKISNFRFPEILRRQVL